MKDNATAKMRAARNRVGNAFKGKKKPPPKRKVVVKKVYKKPKKVKKPIKPLKPLKPLKPVKPTKTVKLPKVPVLPAPEPIVKYKTVEKDSAATLKLIKELKDVNSKLEKEKHE